MDVEQWPVVSRAHLVRAFRPGEHATSEAPFRTLRTHGWSTCGVRINTRSEADRHATGRITLFSVLNMDAARSARRGDAKAASRLAALAAKLESTDAFRRLAEELSGLPGKAVASVIEGRLKRDSDVRLRALLRAVAVETRRARGKRGVPSEVAEVVAGTVCDAKSTYVVISTARGTFAAVPRALALAARREKLGDLVALVTERLDDGCQVSYAVPGIGLTPGTSEAPFSPFGRGARLNELSPSDAKLLSGTPAPLTILVPVTVGP